MREALFIKRNAEKWKKIQQHPSSDPDEKAAQFTELIEDLSYAKTNYPKSKVTKWINEITAGIYQDIYKNRKIDFARLSTFWTHELPLLFRKYHRIFLFTITMFVLFVSVGFYAAYLNPDFVKQSLGESYVEMTQENIQNGDPFGVYKDDSPFNMFIRIAINNIRVAFMTYVGGFTTGLFTLYLMWTNGIMIGCFHYLFFAEALGKEAIMVIWIHGTIEIASIVIAATAGMIIAHGILFAGTYTHRQSFRMAVKDSVKVLISLIPFFIVAAWLESYITHQMSETYSRMGGGLPVWAAALILIGSVTLIVWYYILLPIKREKQKVTKSKNGIIARMQQ